METNATYHSTTPEDVLWTLYRQQTPKTHKAFLARVRKKSREVGNAVELPGMHSRDEMMELSKQCMQDILGNREKTLSHEEMMRLVDNAIAKSI